MGHRRRALFVGLCLLAIMATCAYAQSPIANPGFEEDLSGWTSYSYEEPPYGSGDLPIVGCVGPAPCPFDLLSPYASPEGANVCGLQASGSSKNGGVRQVFSCVSGPATLSVTARAYSEKFAEDGGEAFDNGCRVRMGLVEGASESRGDVASWLTFPWGDAWFTRYLDVAGPGVYTLFIEALQPAATAVMSTLWDNVSWSELPHFSGSDVTVLRPGNFSNPDTTVRIQWTTAVPSSSCIEYGLTEAYGQSVESSQLVTNHDVLLTGLTHTSTYHCRATSSASGYAPWVSDDVTFKTPIQFENIVVSPGTVGSDMKVRWTTDVPATTRVEYGPTDSYGCFTTEISALTASHEATITGLQEDQTYHFRVLGRNSPLYSDAFSADRTFHTLPPPSAQLANGSFEQGYAGQTHSLYPWVQYVTGDETVGFHPIDGLVGPYPKGGPLTWKQSVQAYDASYFIGAGAEWNYKNGGVFQRIYFPSGQLCTLTARYLTMNQGGVPSDTRVRLGIDPNGGVDPASPDIEWWSVYSPTSNSQWHIAAVTTRSGSTGLVTVFLEIEQDWELEWHVAAIDHAAFGAPLAMTIGQLKSSDGDRSAVLQNGLVTYMDPVSIAYYDKSYIRAYIQEADRSAGIAVLFDESKTDLPARGDKVNVTGSVILHKLEAMVVASEWTIVASGQTMPVPFGMSTRAIGGATSVQPALDARANACNVGLRVRICGKVTWVDFSDPWTDATATIDDGAHIVDQYPLRGGATEGVRVKLVANQVYGVDVGDYIEATGIASTEFIDPVWPPDSGDEYYAYTILTGSLSDWHRLASDSSKGPSIPPIKPQPAGTP